jgi:hypothetical protein
MKAWRLSVFSPALNSMRHILIGSKPLKQWTVVIGHWDHTSHIDVFSLFNETNFYSAVITAWLLETESCYVAGAGLRLSNARITGVCHHQSPGFFAFACVFLVFFFVCGTRSCICTMLGKQSLDCILSSHVYIYKYSGLCNLYPGIQFWSPRSRYKQINFCGWPVVPFWMVLSCCILMW